jgi:phosphatidylglycerol:prolipoprotein diacylglycerol transferase
MSDYTTVFFKGFSHEISFNVASVLAEFDIFGRHLTIHWYGVIIAFGFALAVLFGGRRAWVWKISIDKMIDVLIYGTVAGIIGARLYYVIFQWDYYGKHLADIPKIWEGGLAIYGGVIGGVLAAYIVCRVRKMNFFNLLDMIAMSLLLAQGIGRWGNFTNQEAFGTNTNMPWGMRSAKVQEYLLVNQAEFAERGIQVNPTGYVHPTFLYESLWCLIGFVILYIICRKARKFSGQMALCYGVWYGAERTVVEGLRTDSLYITGTNIRSSQLLSAVLAVVCAVALILLWIKYTKNPKPIDGVDYFLEEELKKQALEAKEQAETPEKEEITQAVEEEPAAEETDDEEAENPQEDI